MTQHSSYYGGYLHSEEWYKRRKRAFRIWSALGWRFVMVWYSDGHHWLGYKHLGYEHWWEIMPVSRRINDMEKLFRTRLHMNSVMGTWLAIALLRPWLWAVPLWLVLGGLALHLPIGEAASTVGWGLLHFMSSFLAWALHPITSRIHLPAEQWEPIKQGWLNAWRGLLRLRHGHGLGGGLRTGLRGDLVH